MSEYKSHKVLVKNLPKGKPICSVGNKSTTSLIMGAIFIIGVLLYFNNILVIIPFILYELFFIFKPYHSVFHGYNSYFVFYDRDNKNECNLYYLSELKYWTSSGSFFKPTLTCFLNDGEKVIFEREIDSEIFDYLRKVATKKEIQKKK